MNAVTRSEATCNSGRVAYLAAAKRFLSDFRDRFQNPDCDLRNLSVALDGPPGALTALANEELDRDPHIHGIGIRDFTMEPAG